MLFIAVVLIALALAALAVGLESVVVPNVAVRRRVRGVAAVPDVEVGTRASLSVRGPRPGWLTRMTPHALMARIERNMVLAGRPPGWSRDRVILAKPLGAAVGALFALMVITGTGSPVMVVVGVAGIILGYFVPDLLIYNQATKRQLEMQKALPDTLDQIVISIEAGLGFEAALARAGENGAGPLAEEFVRLIQDIALGMSRREAYLGLAERTSVDDLRGFARSIVQAEEYGVSIASVVRTQAKEMRVGRRTRAEARAQQVPVKILFPLMLCILPVLFVIVLGPPVVHAFAIT